MPDFERILDSLSLHLSQQDKERSAYLRGYIAGKTRARIEVAVILAALVIIATALFSASAKAEEEECADTFLNCETIQIDEDGPDQDPVYDEDDPVYDEMDDYDDL